MNTNCKRKFTSCPVYFPHQILNHVAIILLYDMNTAQGKALQHVALWMPSKNKGNKRFVLLGERDTGMVQSNGWWLVASGNRVCTIHYPFRFLRIIPNPATLHVLRVQSRKLSHIIFFLPSSSCYFYFVDKLPFNGSNPSMTFEVRKLSAKCPTKYKHIYIECWLAQHPWMHFN